LNGQCTVEFTYYQEGAVNASARATIGVLGLDINQTTSTAKIFVSGSLRWYKNDPFGDALGGATFEVCRTHWYNSEDGQLTSLPAPECVTVEDNTGQTGYAGSDEDVEAGKFILSQILLGRYTIQETQGPPGYNTDLKRIETLDLSPSYPDGRVDGPWINSLGQLAPTATTCEAFVAGTAEHFSEVFYNPKDLVINNTNPGVFFYYTQFVSPAKDFTVNIFQTNNQDFEEFFVQNDLQIRIFDEDCGTPKGKISTDFNEGQAFVAVEKGSVNAIYIISVKYDTASVVGQLLPDPSSVLYSFSTVIDGFGLVDFVQDGLELKTK
jgi:hypothetical protein